MTQCSKGMDCRVVRLIKRYPNRKLYDTAQKQYVTLDDLARLIRDGHEVQVTDHASGEDLTAVTLTHIILEQEKKQAGFLPRAVLRGLVQAGGERISTLRHALASPLDLVQQVDEEIERRIRNLTRRGVLGKDEGVRLRDLLVRRHIDMQCSPDDFEEALERVLARLDVVNRADIQSVEEQVERMLDDVDLLLEERAAT